MTKSNGVAYAVAVAVLVSACSRDAQTSKEVETGGPEMAASTSMSGDSADKRGEALVRVVNAAADSKELVVRSDDAHALPAVEYTKVTAYQPIDRNWVKFEVRGVPTGAYTPLATNREMLTDGNRYSIIVMHDKDGAAYDTRVLRDEISGDATKAHIRVIHAAPGVDEVNVVQRGGEKLFDGVNFTSEAGFKAVDAWKGTLEFRSEDGNRVLLTMPNVDLQLGKSYTIVLSRDAKGKLQTFWFEDQQV